MRWEKPQRENPGVVARHDLHCRGLLHGAPRWTRTKNYEAGTYRLSVTGDDGIRMLVDGTQVIDGWFYQAPTTYTADVPLSEGAHTVVVEYFQHTVGPVAKSSESRVAEPPP